MKTKKFKTKHRATKLKHSLSVGQDAYLDRNIEHGLFEACNGNKYLITYDFDLKLSIALTHRHLRPFTCQPLGAQPLEYGQWLGSCRVRLIHALPAGPVRGRPGDLGITDRYACIDCHSEHGGTRGIAIGCIGDNDYDSRDFDEWSLEPLEIHYPFFERLRGSRKGSASLHDRRDIGDFALDQRV